MLIVLVFIIVNVAVIICHRMLDGVRLPIIFSKSSIVVTLKLSVSSLHVAALITVLVARILSIRQLDLLLRCGILLVLISCVQRT